jgi:hypothetical protein
LDGYELLCHGVTSEPRVDQPVHQDPSRPSRARGDRRVPGGGININVTLIFSLSRYGAVMDAFLDGMERAHMRRPSCAADGRSRTPNWLTSTTSGVLLPAVGQAAGGRSPAATAAVGVDVDQGPGLSRHPLCN